MAKALISIAPRNLSLEILDIDNLPMYNQDLDDVPPISWTQFRKKLKVYDAVLFVTPEYNRSIPAVLKNAIDIGSRPYGFNVWDKKPGAVVSVSIGSTGGFGANHHLRQTLVFVNVPTMQHPEAYIGHAAKIFDQSGLMIDESTREYMKKFMDSFSSWVFSNATQLKKENEMTA